MDTNTISKSLYRISLTVHPGPVGAVSNRTIGVNLRKKQRFF